jgi:hypothetical protein
VRPLGLVACGKAKLPHRAAARDLYTGTLFRLSRAYVERHCDGWAILSAKHGLVLPDWELEPYDETLVGAPRQVVRRWQATVRESLELQYPGREFLVICGRDYGGALRGLPHREAFGGLPIGRKMQALKAALSEG